MQLLKTHGLWILGGIVIGMVLAVNFAWAATTGNTLSFWRSR